MQNRRSFGETGEQTRGLPRSGVADLLFSRQLARSFIEVLRAEEFATHRTGEDIVACDGGTRGRAVE